MTSQPEYWNDAAGRAWVAGQALLDAQLAPFGALAMEAARVAPGDRVLDVGCGCGATTLELADRVGPAGHVVGIDVSAPMLARARERVHRANAELRLGDATTLPLEPAAFDVLYSRFGVMFFEQPVAAFAHLKTALVTGGRVALVAWQAMDKNAWVTVPAAAVADLVTLPPLGDGGEPGPFAWADRERARDILAAAGYRGVDVAGRELDVLVGGSVPLEQAVAFTIDFGPLRRVLEEAPEGVRRTAARRITDALARHQSGGAVRLPAAVWIVTARA